ncbi:hypothetical protein [Methylobacterium haplocladii]|nr:hypothetical protein [Methylobacterium haplocladii]
MTGSFGGPEAVALDSANGAITWIADTNGLTDSLILSVPKAARGGWLASTPTTLVFDVHRTVTGSTIDEWLGRSSVRVLPATDSALVRQQAAFTQILVAGQPGSGVVLPALTTGPQGPTDTAYTDQRVAELQAQIDAVTALNADLLAPPNLNFHRFTMTGFAPLICRI